MIRDDIKTALVSAMKAKDAVTVGTLRMVQAAIKNRDIELRTSTAPADDDAMLADVLRKMIKQRRDSIAMYQTGGRPELAAAEQAEVTLIENFLPAQMSTEQARAVIEAVAPEIGAAGPKDIGRLMTEVKARHAGAMDMGAASGLAKAVLAGS